jgi:hypothetical protein
MVPPWPPLTAEQRRECYNLRSKVYQSTRKATNDTGVAAFAAMRAKNAYLKSMGCGFTCAVRGPVQPKAKAASMTASHTAKRKANQTRTAMQLRYQEPVHTTMAELGAPGADASIPVAARLLRMRKADEAVLT